MSNINELVQESFTEEGKKTDIGIGIASGLGGMQTGGTISGWYNSYKADKARKELDRLEGKKPGEYESDKMGRHILYAVLGSIPVVGSVTNAMIAKEHHKLAERLDLMKNEISPAKYRQLKKLLDKADKKKGKK